MLTQTCSVVIAAYNEAPTISGLVDAIQRDLPDAEVVVVDDGSTDGTAAAAERAGASVLRHPYNIGNGAAVKAGIRAASGDVIVFMDADGQHDPAEIPRLIEALDAYDMVVGARNPDQQASLPRGVMNRLFNRLAAYVSGFKVRDLTSGFRAVKADVARDLLPMLPNGYSWPTTMTLVLLRSGMSLKYVPINVRSRAHGRSRIRPLRDSTRFLLIMLKICTLYSPIRIFLPVALMLAGLGAGNYAYTYCTAGRFTNMSALMFTAAVLVFMQGLISEQISQMSLLRRQIRPMARSSGPPPSDPSAGADA